MALAVGDTNQNLVRPGRTLHVPVPHSILGWGTPRTSPRPQTPAVYCKYSSTSRQFHRAIHPDDALSSFLLSFHVDIPPD